MGRAAREAYVIRYTGERNYEQLLLVYEQALSGRRLAAVK